MEHGHAKANKKYIQLHIYLLCSLSCPTLIIFKGLSITEYQQKIKQTIVPMLTIYLDQNQLDRCVLLGSLEYSMASYHDTIFYFHVKIILQWWFNRLLMLLILLLVFFFFILHFLMYQMVDILSQCIGNLMFGMSM